MSLIFCVSTLTIVPDFRCSKNRASQTDIDPGGSAKFGHNDLSDIRAAHCAAFHKPVEWKWIKSCPQCHVQLPIVRYHFLLQLLISPSRCQLTDNGGMGDIIVGSLDTIWTQGLSVGWRFGRIKIMLRACVFLGSSSIFGAFTPHQAQTAFYLSRSNQVKSWSFTRTHREPVFIGVNRCTSSTTCSKCFPISAWVMICRWFDRTPNGLSSIRSYIFGMGTCICDWYSTRDWQDKYS